MRHTIPAPCGPFRSACLTMLALLVLCAPAPAKEARNLDYIQVTVIKTTQPKNSTTMTLGLQVRNTSGRFIEQCQVSVILYRNEEIVNFENVTVITSNEGLAPDDYVLTKAYIPDVEPDSWDLLGFKIKSIRFKD